MPGPISRALQQSTGWTENVLLCEAVFVQSPLFHKQRGSQSVLLCLLRRPSKQKNITSCYHILPTATQPLIMHAPRPDMVDRVIPCCVTPLFCRPSRTLARSDSESENSLRDPWPRGGGQRNHHHNPGYRSPVSTLMVMLGRVCRGKHLPLVLSGSTHPQAPRLAGSLLRNGSNNLQHFCHFC